jgi:GH35 family endo-1,4-beta-xylanase
MSQTENNDPYFREDPGVGLQRITVCKFDLEKDYNLWKFWRTNDGRVFPNKDSTFELIDNPFDPGSLILLTTHFDPSVAGKSFGGYGIRAPINPSIAVNDKTYIEFDFYFPHNAAGKYMRLELWSTSTGGEGYQTNSGVTGTNRTQLYIRTADLEKKDALNPDWIGFYKGDTWYKITLCAVSPVLEGIWEYLNIDLHTETGVKLEGDLLMIGNIRITQPDVNGVPIPNVVNTKSFSEVEPVKNKYNPENGYFYIGMIGTGKVLPDTIRGRHFNIFVDDNNLKPECHVSAPQWLKGMFPSFKFKSENEGIEWKLPTEGYLGIRDSCTSGAEYKMHGHCLAWINQSPPWMRQIIPEHITSMEWNREGLFYSGANNAAGPFLKVTRDTARRIYFDHIMYVMRHFMTTDTRYGSNKERGIIPFHSYDVLNVDIHESRHSALVKDNPKEWKTALKQVSWLMAMTDSDTYVTRQHYVYLLFKFAHIAVPNAQMAANYKAGYNNSDAVPEYMKLDNHDKNGSIDSYITEEPPVLIYNEYEFATGSKANVVYNMVRELNTVWKTDPLYDGRNLIECVGIQGHDVVSSNLIAQSIHAMDLLVSLIEEGLLNSICYSEMDIRQPNNAPGGEALAPSILNQKQADALGYQYALLFKMFEKYKKYIDHITIWRDYGSSWMKSYVLFDHDKMASQAYYAIMDPDRFIKGHSYLDDFFKGEYDKVRG